MTVSSASVDNVLAYNLANEGIPQIDLHTFLLHTTILFSVWDGRTRTDGCVRGVWNPGRPERVAAARDG
jgi:hypothetical protein